MADTQTTRRLKYGLNIAVALGAALAIVVLINALMAYAFRNAPAGAKGWLRLDVTATRQYSLSPQTKKVLAGLDGEYRLVAAFTPTTEREQRVLDLLGEYPRYSEQVTVQQFDPFVNVVANEQFLQSVLDRYAQELGPVQASVDEAIEQVRAIAPVFAEASTALQSAVEAEGDAAATWSQRVQLAVLTQIGQELPRVLEQVGQLRDQPLPDYDTILRTLESALSQLAQRYPQIAAQYQALVRSGQTPAGVKEALLQVVSRITALTEPTERALRGLEQTPSPTRYNEVRAILENTRAVAVVGPDAVRAIPVAEMYQAVEEGAGAGQEPGPAALGFLGEEKLTGALVSLGLEQQPLAVFVNSGPQPAIGPGGEYQFVAQRLESANFQVRQWNPQGQMTPMGQRMAPGPPPEPEPGQPAVWIVLAPPPPNPQNPASMAGGAREGVADLVRERLAAGDGVLTLFSANPAAQFGIPDAVLEVLADWGITPELSKVVVQELTVPGQERTPNWRFLISRWPGALPVTAALSGMRGAIIGPSPIAVTSPPEGEPAGEGAGDDAATAAKPVQTWPLIELQEPRMWVTEKFGNIHSVSELTYEPDNARDSVTVGLAAERGDARLVVITDGYFALDQLAMAGNGGLPAEMTGLALPANSELVVNSALWLADLEQLIAASPRTQDIRRIEAMSPGAMQAVGWVLLAVVPGAILAAGVGVYLVRRRD